MIAPEQLLREGDTMRDDAMLTMSALLSPQRSRPGSAHTPKVDAVEWSSPRGDVAIARALSVGEAVAVTSTRSLSGSRPAPPGRGSDGRPDSCGSFIPSKGERGRDTSPRPDQYLKRGEGARASSRASRSPSIGGVTSSAQVGGRGSMSATQRLAATGRLNSNGTATPGRTGGVPRSRSLSRTSTRSAGDALSEPPPPRTTPSRDKPWRLGRPRSTRASPGAEADIPVEVFSPATNTHVGERERHVGERERHVGERERHVGEQGRDNGVSSGVDTGTDTTAARSVLSDIRAAMKPHPNAGKRTTSGTGTSANDASAGTSDAAGMISEAHRLRSTIRAHALRAAIRSYDDEMDSLIRSRDGATDGSGSLHTGQAAVVLQYLQHLRDTSIEELTALARETGIHVDMPPHRPPVGTLYTGTTAATTATASTTHTSTATTQVAGTTDPQTLLETGYFSANNRAASRQGTLYSGSTAATAPTHSSTHTDTKSATVSFVSTLVSSSPAVDSHPTPLHTSVSVSSVSAVSQPLPASTTASGSQAGVSGSVEGRLIALERRLASESARLATREEALGVIARQLTTPRAATSPSPVRDNSTVGTVSQASAPILLSAAPKRGRNPALSPQKAATETFVGTSQYFPLPVTASSYSSDITSAQHVSAAISAALYASSTDTAPSASSLPSRNPRIAPSHHHHEEGINKYVNIVRRAKHAAPSAATRQMGHKQQQPAVVQPDVPVSPQRAATLDRATAASRVVAKHHDARARSGRTASPTLLPLPTLDTIVRMSQLRAATVAAAGQASANTTSGDSSKRTFENSSRLLPGHTAQVIRVSEESGHGSTKDGIQHSTRSSSVPTRNRRVHSHTQAAPGGSHLHSPPRHATATGINNVSNYYQGGKGAWSPRQPKQHERAGMLDDALWIGDTRQRNVAQEVTVTQKRPVDATSPTATAPSSLSPVGTPGHSPARVPTTVRRVTAPIVPMLQLGRQGAHMKATEQAATQTAVPLTVADLRGSVAVGSGVIHSYQPQSHGYGHWSSQGGSGSHGHSVRAGTKLAASVRYVSASARMLPSAHAVWGASSTTVAGGKTGAGWMPEDAAVSSHILTDTQTCNAAGEVQQGDINDMTGISMCSDRTAEPTPAVTNALGAMSSDVSVSAGVGTALPPVAHALPPPLNGPPSPIARASARRQLSSTFQHSLHTLQHTSTGSSWTGGLGQLRSVGVGSYTPAAPIMPLYHHHHHAASGISRPCAPATQMQVPMSATLAYCDHRDRPHRPKCPDSSSSVGPQPTTTAPSTPRTRSPQTT